MDDQNTQNKGDVSNAPKAGHWSKLAEALGAKVTSDEPLNDLREPEPTAPIPTKQERRPKPAAKPPVRSNWKALASMLGIGGGSTESDPDDDAVDDATELKSAEQVEAPVAKSCDPSPEEVPDEKSPQSRDFERPKSREFERPRRNARGRRSRRDANEPPRDADPVPRPTRTAAPTENPAPIPTPLDAAAKLGLNFDDDETDIGRSQSQNVLQSMFKPSEIPYWEEEIADEPDDSDSSADSDADAVRFERQNELDYADDETTSERSDAGDDDRPNRARRSRSRRRRGRGRDRGGRAREDASADVVEDRPKKTTPDASDSTLRLEASADLFDRTEDSDEVDFDTDFDVDDDGDEAAEIRVNQSNDRPREKRRVTSWDDAIAVIVQRNLKNRSPSGGGGSPRSTRGRRR